MCHAARTEFPWFASPLTWPRPDRARREGHQSRIQIRTSRRLRSAPRAQAVDKMRGVGSSRNHDRLLVGGRHSVTHPTWRVVSLMLVHEYEPPPAQLPHAIPGALLQCDVSGNVLQYGVRLPQGLTPGPASSPPQSLGWKQYSGPEHVKVPHETGELLAASAAAGVEPPSADVPHALKAKSSGRPHSVNLMRLA